MICNCTNIDAAPLTLVGETSFTYRGMRKENAPAAYPLMKRPQRKTGMLRKQDIMAPMMEMRLKMKMPLRRLVLMKAKAVKAPMKAPT